jgi:hypothetical protein
MVMLSLIPALFTGYKYRRYTLLTWSGRFRPQLGLPWGVLACLARQTNTMFLPGYQLAASQLNRT